MLSFPFSDELFCDANFFGDFIILIKKDLGDFYINQLYKYVNRKVAKGRQI